MCKTENLKLDQDLCHGHIRPCMDCVYGLYVHSTRLSVPHDSTLVPHLSEAQLVVQVFVHLFDHVLQAQVGLRRSQLLHHQLHVDEAALPCVVSVHGWDRN